MAPIRVAYFIHSLEQGGAERQLCELIAGLDRERFAPSLVLGDRRGHYGDELSAPRVYIDDPYFPSPAGAARLLGALRGLKPDLVHVWKSWESIVGRVVASRLPDVKVVASVRRPRLPASMRWGERLTADFADLHVVNSFGIRDELVREAHLDPARVEVVESGADLARFSPLDPAARAAERRRWGAADGPLLVAPGRLSPEKNQLTLARALGRLRRDGRLPPGTRVVFAGRDSLPLYGRRVKLEARAAGLGDVARFLGAVDDVPSLLGAADLSLLPSHFEGLSSAAVESLACATPVLISREANADAVVTDGVEGFEAPSPSIDDLTATLARALATPGSIRAAMGQRGRAHAEARFDRRRMVSAMSSVYERLVGRR